MAFQHLVAGAIFYHAIGEAKYARVELKKPTMLALPISGLGFVDCFHAHLSLLFDMP